MPLRLRRGTDAERLGILPAAGEPIYTTDTKKLYIGDGETTGGIEVSTESSGGGIVDLVSDTSPQLGGNLDLNSNSIIGIGHINIDGTINATGNINLGDSTEDAINIAGTVSSNITPSGNEIFNIGSPTLNWNKLYSKEIYGEFYGNLISDDTTVLVNTTTKDIIARDIIATGSLSGLVEGDIRGSVIASDSSVIVDSISKTLDINKIESTSGVLDIGNNVTPVDIDFYTSSNVLNAYTINTPGQDNPNIEIFTSRGSLESPTTLEIGDQVAGLAGAGWNGSEFQTTGALTTAILDINESTSEITGGMGFLVPKPGTGSSEFWQMIFSGVDGSLTVSGAISAPKFTGALEGDVKGSVFGDDSTLLVDGVNNIIPGYISVVELKNVVAASTDFEDFQTRIANL